MYAEETDFAFVNVCVRGYIIYLYPGVCPEKVKVIDAVLTTVVLVCGFSCCCLWFLLGSAKFEVIPTFILTPCWAID